MHRLVNTKKIKQWNLLVNKVPKHPDCPKKMREASYTREGSEQEITQNPTYLATELYNCFRALPQPVHVNLRTIYSNML